MGCTVTCNLGGMLPVGVRMMERLSGLFYGLCFTSDGDFLVFG